MIIGSIKLSRCAKNFVRLPISPMFTPVAEDKVTRYIIWGPQKRELLGEFSFWDNGQITDIFFNRIIKGKKKIADVILSVKDFITQEAEKRNLDKIKLQIPINNKKELRRAKSILSKLGKLLQEPSAISDFTISSNTGKHLN